MPYSFAIIKEMQGKAFPHQPLLCLLDSGSTLSWIKSSIIPKEIMPTTSGKPIIGVTMAGKFTSSKKVEVQNIIIPEMLPTKMLRTLELHLMEIIDCIYNIIFGRDFCARYKIKLDFDSQQIQSEGIMLQMRELPAKLDENLSIILEKELHDMYLLQNHDGYKLKTFLSSCSNKIILEDTIKQQDHLTILQQQQLLQALQDYKSLFDGKLGKFNKYKIKIKLKSNATPQASKIYPVARAHLDAFKERLDKLVAQEVLEPSPRSEWVSGSFIIPKKDATP